MLMDDPRDWQARIDSLQTAVSETVGIMFPVLQDHVADMGRVFGAQDQPDVDDNPFAVVETMLGDVLPGEFLNWSAEDRPDLVPEAFRSYGRRDFYQLVKETIQLVYCLELLESLATFADEGFTFFKDGYYTNKKLPVSTAVPPRAIMRTFINQVSFDLSVIQHAVNQRRRLQDRLPTQQGCTLTMADQLAKMAIDLAISANYLPENTRIITYLAKSVRARLVPYSHTLLISVAYASIHTGINPSRDFLALPHEIGHHLYWNGIHPESGLPMRDRLLQSAGKAGIGQDDWRLRWLEEMFADTYALLLAGPVIVLDFQDMLDDDMSSHFREDTDKHPIPEIRPFIQTNILRRLTDDSGTIIYTHECDKLDDNWRIWLNQHPLKANYSLIGRPQPINGQAILDELAPLITVILDTLSAIVPTEKEYTGMVGSDDVSLLYSEFEGYDMPDDDIELVNMFLDGEGTDEQLGAILESNPEISFKDHVAEATHLELDKISSAEWMQLLRSFGWSSEGPMSDGGATTTGTGTDDSTYGSGTTTIKTRRS